MEGRFSPAVARWVELVLRGAVAIAAGISALFISPAFAKLFFAVYLVVDGALALALAAGMAAGKRARLLIAADGIADILLAAFLLFWAPNIAVLIVVVGAWLIATGILEIAASVFLPRWPGLPQAIAIVGLVSCVFGVIAFDWTDLAEIGLLYVFGAYALIAGVLFLTVGVLIARVVRPQR